MIWNSHPLYKIINIIIYRGCIISKLKKKNAKWTFLNKNIYKINKFIISKKY